MPAHHHHHQVNIFLSHHGLSYVIAFSGSADAIRPHDHSPADSLHLHHDIPETVEEIISHCLRSFDPTLVAILTGGTCWGVPHMVMQKARELGFRTIGIFPEIGVKYVCPELLDLGICVEPRFGESAWGDESELFAKVADGLVVIGGGHGTMIEVAHFLKYNESILSQSRKGGDLQPLKPVSPIAGTGGAADLVYMPWVKAEVAAECMPQRKVYSGCQAAEFVRARL